MIALLCLIFAIQADFLLPFPVDRPVAQQLESINRPMHCSGYIFGCREVGKLYNFGQLVRIDRRFRSHTL